MWFKHRAWIPVAWTLSVVNLVAVWFAAQPGEPFHATAHALLGVSFALGARHLRTRQIAASQNDYLQEALDHNEQLQQVVDDTQGRVFELEDRLDFAERLLAKHKDSGRESAP
jgi:hypothetical protein